MRHGDISSSPDTVGVAVVNYKMPRLHLARCDSGAIDRAVRDFFDPEFLNRLDEVVHFAEISAGAAREIVELQLSDVADRLARRDVALLLNPNVVDHLARTGLDRPMEPEV